MTSRSDQGTILERACEAIVIGGSAGSTGVMREILSPLPPDFPAAIFVVQHVHESDDGSLAEHLGRACRLRVLVPCDKQPIEKSCVFVAPANYHMLLERNNTIALSVEEKVKWSRPSIDVTFEAAAQVYGERLVAVILSGANDDGAEGMKAVKDYGGFSIVQSPENAESPVMPLAAIESSDPDCIRAPADISQLLLQLACAEGGSGRFCND